MAGNRRQLEQALTDGFDQDLHPHHMAGQSLARERTRCRARARRTT
jgi:hypothetical protein